MISCGMMSGMEKCTRCGDPLDAQTRAHWENEPLDPTGNGFGHKDLCCDCHNLSCGKPADQINAERAAKGKAPISVPTDCR
jgi:hypothetical protein